MGTNHRSRKPADLEARLDQGIRAMLGTGPADYDPEDWRSLREHLRLQVLYPGKAVAFRDHREGPDLRLVRREVLCASRSQTVVANYLSRLPESERSDVFMDYIESEAARRRGL